MLTYNILINNTDVAKWFSTESNDLYNCKLTGNLDEINNDTDVQIYQK